MSSVQRDSSNICLDVRLFFLTIYTVVGAAYVTTLLTMIQFRFTAMLSGRH